jgi:Fe-Mn family superoxide dismutase
MSDKKDKATFTNRDLSENIKKTLGLDREKLDEAYVAQVKQFNLPTELLSPANKRNHIELYEGYVASFNRISAELDTADRQNANSNNSPYRDLKIDETYNMNAAYLHQLYFSNISDLHSEISMDSLSYMRLARDFGSFDDWQRDFVACCMASRCGWAITYFNTYMQRYMNCPVDLHSLNVPIGAYPVIVMDVWQHAYYRDYLKDIKTYVYGMMKQLNWKVIERRFEKADSIQKAIKV